jgi:hypothetical protein
MADVDDIHDLKFEDGVSSILLTNKTQNYIYLCINSFLSASLILICLYLLTFIPIDTNFKYFITFLGIFSINSLSTFYYSILQN